MVFDTVSHSALGTAPNYGYAYSTIEDSTKITSHSVGLTGLTAGTIYYYKVISSGSPEAVSPEKSFNTPSIITTTLLDISRKTATAVTVGTNGVGTEVATTDTTTDVQGATTKKVDNKGEVQGTSDSNKKESSNWQDTEFIGLAWYWWFVIIAAAGGLGWWAFGVSRKDN